MKFYERNEFWALGGIIVGFLLSVLWEIIKNKLSIHRKRKAIESELRTNLGLIPQKIDLLNKVKTSLDQETVLPSYTVHYTTYLYDHYIGNVGPHLTEDQRSCLHVVYESMKFADRFLDSLFRDFVELRSSGQLSEPFKAFSGMCEDLIERSNLTQEMIKEYLMGKPRKVSWDE